MTTTPGHPCTIKDCPHPGTLPGASRSPDTTPYFCEAHREAYYLHNRGMS